jgi:hypothetical protein
MAGTGAYFVMKDDDNTPPLEVRIKHKEPEKSGNESIYDFNVVTMENENISMRWYRKKVLLIVNMARKNKFSY